MQDQFQFSLIALVIRSAQVRSDGESTLTFSKVNLIKVITKTNLSRNSNGYDTLWYVF